MGSYDGIGYWNLNFSESPKLKKSSKSSNEQELSLEELTHEFNLLNSPSYAYQNSIWVNANPEHRFPILNFADKINLTNHPSKDNETLLESLKKEEKKEEESWISKVGKWLTNATIGASVAEDPAVALASGFDYKLKDGQLEWSLNPNSEGALKLRESIAVESALPYMAMFPYAKAGLWVSENILPYMTANGWLQATQATGTTPAWLTPTTATAIDATLAGSATGASIYDMYKNGPSVENVTGTALGLGGLAFEAAPTLMELYDSGRTAYNTYRLGRSMNSSLRTTSKPPTLDFGTSPMHSRFRLGEVEIDDPFNNYRMLGPGGTSAFIEKGSLFAPNYKPATGVGRFNFDMNEPMYSRGGLWYGAEAADRYPGLLVTREPMYVASSHARPFPQLDEANSATKWGTRRVPVNPDALNLQNTGVYSWDPNYYGNGQGGYVRLRGDRPMMGLYERPKSRITDAERVGIPKGDRNNNVPFLEGAESNVPEDIVLINRANTPYTFENGRIVWNNILSHDIDGNLLGKRITHHFTLDAPVTAHSGGNWDLAENTMIVPYRHTVLMNGHPLNVEPMDTYFGGFGRFSLDLNKVKILTANPKLYRQYKLQGIDVEFSQESANLIERANKIKAELEPLHLKNYTPGSNMSNEEVSRMIDLENQLREIESQNYNLVLKWTEANSRRPTMDDMKLIESETGLPTGASAKEPYGFSTTSNPNINYHSTPATHSNDFVLAIETGKQLPFWNVNDPEVAKNLISPTRRKLYEEAIKRYPHLFGN